MISFVFDEAMTKCEKAVPLEESILELTGEALLHYASGEDHSIFVVKGMRKKCPDFAPTKNVTCVDAPAVDVRM